MSIVVTEKSNSPEIGNDKATLSFTISGTTDGFAAYAALLSSIVSYYGGLKLKTAKVRPAGRDDLWDGTADYDKSDNKKDSSDDPSKDSGHVADFSFDTSGGTQHITASLETQASYVLGGAAARDFGGAIGYTGNSVDGCDVIVPAFAFSVPRYIAAEDMTSAFIQKLYDKTGMVNSDVVNVVVSVNGNNVTLTFQPSELLYLGATGKPRSDDWEITLRFAGSKNRSGFDVGGITVAAKGGWEYLWVFHEESTDATAHALIRSPKQVNIEKVYPTDTLSDLLTGP